MNKSELYWGRRNDGGGVYYRYIETRGKLINGENDRNEQLQLIQYSSRQRTSESLEEEKLKKLKANHKKLNGYSSDRIGCTTKTYIGAKITNKEFTNRQHHMH